MTQHNRLIAKWSACNFGVKQRVFNELVQTTVQYILKTPSYSKEENIMHLIDCIDKHSDLVLKEVKQMNTKIKKI
jgi:hypothetical protein